MPRISELHENVANFATIVLHKVENAARLKNTTNFKPPQIYKGNFFQNTTIFSMCRFIPTFDLLS